MTRKKMTAIGLVALLTVPALVWWLAHTASANFTTSQSAGTRTVPLGPPQTSDRVSLPVSYHAFPVDILARTRAALIAGSQPGRQ